MDKKLEELLNKTGLVDRMREIDNMMNSTFNKSELVERMREMD